MLQRRAAAHDASATVPPIVHDVLASPGQPLDAATRADMEPRFGHDFGDVRVHADSKAAESARAVNAQAYTVGRDVVFAACRHMPTGSDGRRLLAHELTHVVQQEAGAGRDVKATLGEIDDGHEWKANAIADQIATEGSVGGIMRHTFASTALTIQRQHAAGTPQNEKTITIIVKNGEDIFDIAFEYHTTPQHIKELNKLTTVEFKAGQKLVVPEGTTPKAPGKEKDQDDIYGRLQRPHFGDYTTSKADLEKTIDYIDPISGQLMPCKVKETFFGIWMSYQIDEAYKDAHLKGKDTYGNPKAFTRVIARPNFAILLVPQWNELDIDEKVQIYDNNRGGDLFDHLDSKNYPKLNAELERRIKLFRLDNTTTVQSLQSAWLIGFNLSRAIDSPFGKWFVAHPSLSKFGYRPIPPGPLKHLGGNDSAVTIWNGFSLQQKVDYFVNYPE